MEIDARGPRLGVFRVYSGRMGNSPEHRLVVAENEAHAIALASPSVEARGRMTAERVCDATLGEMEAEWTSM